MNMPEITLIEWQNKFETEDACMKALANSNTPTAHAGKIGLTK